MKKYIITLSILLFALSNASGQIILRGSVKLSPEDQTAAFANIVLKDVADTTRIIAGTITDLNGNYCFERLSMGGYILNISMIGYNSITETIQLRLPSFGTDVVKNYELTTNIHEMETVLVKHTARQQYIDKTVHTITKEDIKNTVHGLDVIGRLPQLSVDVVSQKLKSTRGGNVKILINGANASELELIALNSDQIHSVEYYDFPPARFAGFNAVVNIKTKNIVNGFSGGIEIQHAFTTGFGNDNFFLKYNNGANQFSINYNLNYRDYTDIDAESRYDYQLDGLYYEREQSDRNKFGYITSITNFSYLNHRENDYLFQASFHPNYQYIHNKSTSTIIRKIGLIQEVDRAGRTKSNTKQFLPSLDLYFWKQLPKQQEIIVNLVGTYQKGDREYDHSEYYDEAPILADLQEIENTKYSIITELFYAKTIKNGRISVGNRIAWEDLDSHIDNNLNNARYNTTILSDYFYGEYSGQYKKWMYRLTIGATYRHTENFLADQSSWIFRPLVLVGYKFSDNLTIRVGFSQTNTEPSLSQLSDNASYIDDNIISKGNPLLKSGFSNSTFIGVNYNSKLISFFASGAFHYSKNPINSYFIEEPPYMVLAYENAKSFQSYGFHYGVQIAPFKSSLLLIKLEGNFLRNTIHSKQAGNYSYTSIPFAFDVSFNCKNFTAFYQGNVVTNQIDGPYLRSNEKISNIGVRYRLKNWTASLMCMWFLTDAKNKTRTIPYSIVKYNFNNTINDNSSMITLGISYRFSKGKKYSESQRNIINKDNDTGL